MLDFATLTRPGTPNTCLLAPDGLCEAATPDGPGPVFDASPDDVFAAARAAAMAMDGVSEVGADEDAYALSFVARTKLLRFKDDVDVAVMPREGGAAIAIYSRSRVGHGDLGANEKRVAAFVTAVRTRLARGRS